MTDTDPQRSFEAWTVLLLVLSACAGFSSNRLAAAESVPTFASPQEPSSKPTAETAGDDEEEGDEDDEDEESTPIVIRNGNLWIGDGRILRRADLLIEDGKISGIGHDLEAPDDAQEIDATGQVVSPGFVIPLITRGFGIDGGEGETVEDSLNPFDPQVKMALAAGITSVMSKGGRGGKKPSGQSRLVKMAPGDLDSMANGPIDTVLQMRVPLSPRDFRSFQDLVDKTLEYMKEKAAYDAQMLAKAKEDAKSKGKKGGKKPEAKDGEGAKEGEKKATKKGDGPKEPKAPSGAKELARVLDGEARLWITSGGSLSEDGLRQALEISELLGVGVVLDRPYTGWVVADRIARTGSMALINPRQQIQPDPARPDETGSNLAMAAILHEAGVPVAVTCPSGWFGGQSLGLNGLLGQDLHTPFVDAAYAVRGGLPNRAGLSLLTLDAARLVGVEDRVGSLEVGKDADILLLDGDPLHYKTFVQTALVDGRVVYEKSKEPFYSHIKR